MAENGSMTAGDRIAKVEAVCEKMEREGCPLHIGIGREIGEMKRVGGWIIGLQIMTLLSFTGGLLLLYVKVIGHG